MRKVVVSEFLSLDGVMEDPSLTFQFASDERRKFKLDELSAADALLLGRVTYEGFTAAWPSVSDEEGYADVMNGYPKYVVSSTLEEPLEWNNSTLVKGNVAEEVAGLKQQPGKDILGLGSADVVNTLMEHDLIDEYRMMVFPVVLGSGKRLFADGKGQKALELVGSKIFSAGVVFLTYRPSCEQGSEVKTATKESA